MTLQESKSLQNSHCEAIVASVETFVEFLPATNTVERLNIGVGIASGRETHFATERIDSVWSF